MQPARNRREEFALKYDNCVDLIMIIMMATMIMVTTMMKKITKIDIHEDNKRIHMNQQVMFFTKNFFITIIIKKTNKHISINKILMISLTCGHNKSNYCKKINNEHPIHR